MSLCIPTFSTLTQKVQQLRKLIRPYYSLNNSHQKYISISSPLYSYSILIVAFMILQLCGQFFQIPALKLLKPIPIIMLIIRSFACGAYQGIKIALMFSLLGDILLMLQNQFIYFQLGTLSFLFAHFGYIGTFWKDFRTSSFHFKSSFIVIAALIFNAHYLWQSIPNKLLFLPYGFILATMVVFAFNRKSNALYSFKKEECQNGKIEQLNLNFKTVATGAALFFISDYTIALCKFKGFSQPILGFFIMATYYSAQFLITQGYCQRYAVK